MHPGPINRGVEIAGDLPEMERFIVADQDQRHRSPGVIMYLMLGGAQAEAA